MPLMVPVRQLMFGVLLGLLAVFSCSSAQLLDNGDKAVLQELLTTATGWRPQYSLADIDNACAWTGIQCNVIESVNRLVRIEYGPESNLTGTLPNSLGNLTYLTYVDFEEGELSGTIPASLTILPYLEHLALAENYFSGQLPTEWTPSIRQLDIHSNLLSGSIPSVLFDYLQYLDVSQNAFTCPLPFDSIRNMTNRADFVGLILLNNQFEITGGTICNSVTPGISKFEMAPQYKPLDPDIPAFTSFFETQAMKVGVFENRVYFYSLNRSRLFNAEEFVMFEVQALAEEYDDVGTNFFDLFDRFSSELIRESDTSFRLEARFVLGTLMSFTFDIIQRPGFLSTIKVGWILTNYTSPTTDANTFRMMLTMYVRLPLELQTRQFECDAGQAGFDVSAILDPVGISVANCQEFRYQSADYDLTFLWALEAEVDGAPSPITDFSGSELYVTDVLRASNRAYELDLFRPPLRPPREQWMAFGMEVNFQKFTQRLVYDPEIRLNVLFGDEPPQPSQAWIAAIVVGGIAVAIGVVVAVPKARKAVFPFLSRKPDMPRGTDMSTMTPPASPQSGWSRANTVELDIRNTKD